MSKGEQTRALILNDAMALASQIGLEGLSIGSLATRLNMSKSGLFAHFGSKEDLQLAVLRRYQNHFVETVFRPALASPRGLPRLRALFGNWLALIRESALPGGCLVTAAAHEYDDQPGPVRDYVVVTLRELRSLIAKAVRMAIDEGHLRADTDHWQLAYEIHAMALAAHQDHRLFEDKRTDKRALRAFERLLADYAPATLH